MEKYKIIINRRQQAEEGIKGYNKCKDNKLAFIQHKKGTLFPRKGVVDPYDIMMERRNVIEEAEKMIKRLEAEQLHSKEVYNYGYHAHISPRMSNNPSANQSFMSADKRSIGKHMSTTSVDNPNNKSQLKLHPMYDDDRAANNLSYKLSEIKRQFNL